MYYRSVFSFLFAMIRPYKWHYCFMFITPCIAAFYDFANNYALKLLIDIFSSNMEVSSYIEVAYPIVIFVSAQILLDVIWRLSDVVKIHSEPYVRQSILMHTYNYIQNHSYFFFQNTPSGSITSKVKGILDGYDTFWANLHCEFTPLVANTIVGSIMLAVVNVEICLFISTWIIVYVVIVYHLSKKLDHLSMTNANDRHKIFGIIADNITNIFTIFSFSTKKYESDNVDSVIKNEFNLSTIKFYKASLVLNIIAGLLYWVMLISLFFMIIYLRKTNQISTGDIAFVMGMVLSMSSELWDTIQKMQDFMRALGDFKSSFEVLVIPNETSRISSKHSIVVKKPSIRFDNVQFAYEKGRNVFKKLNLQIRSGEKVGLVGPSGAGKSTLISLLLRYFSPIKGEIFIDDKNISNFSVDSVRANIAVIPQDILLFHRSILENIRYGNLGASEEDVINAAKQANIHEYIMSLPHQYFTVVGERGTKLSGGQRQRIAIARAILKNAPILILDEATSSLDTETEQSIQLSLNNILNNKKVTVIAIAHRLSTLKQVQRILVLKDGMIVEEGTHDELLSSGSMYKRLWDSQQI